MSVSDERALAERIKAGDKGAQQQLILANLTLVLAIVRDYKDCGLPRDDLIQEGNLGLIRASQDFDPVAYGNRFWTYASFWIRTSIHRALAANVSLIRSSEYVGVLKLRLRRAIHELRGQIAQGEGVCELAQASLDEVARRMGVSLETLQNARGTRLDGNARLRGDVEAEPVALQELPTVPQPPETDLINQENDELVHKALAHLHPFEAWVIRERYGFRAPLFVPEQRKSSSQRIVVDKPETLARTGPAYYQRTLGEIGLDCGLSVHRVRLVEKTALHKLRKLLGPCCSHQM